MFIEFLRVTTSEYSNIPAVANIPDPEIRADNPLNQEILTKGDNNPYDDITLYKNLKWLERRHVVGKVKGSVLLQ